MLGELLPQGAKQKHAGISIFSSNEGAQGEVCYIPTY